MNFTHGQRARKGLETVMGDLVHLGHGNFVRWQRVVGLFPASGAEGRRLRAGGNNSGRLLNLSGNHKTRSVILTDSDHVILAAKDVAALWQQVEMKREQADG